MQEKILDLKNSKLIAIDMDEVLTETVKGVLKFHNYMCNSKPLKYQDITSYDLREVPGFEYITKEYALQYFKEFFDSPSAINTDPVRGAREKLVYFKTLGYRFVVITGRMSTVEKMSRAYLEKWYPGIFDDIYFCSYLTDHQLDKFTICKELGIDIIIEDHLENSIKYTQNGMQVILLDKPRNKNYDSKTHKNITKVTSWDEINTFEELS